jgi:hypothetical protein
MPGEQDPVQKPFIAFFDRVIMDNAKAEVRRTPDKKTLNYFADLPLRGKTFFGHRC